MTDSVTVSLPAFQRFQLAFTAHLRDPKNNRAPAGVTREHMAVYEEIVFNNLFESVSACFPVARKVLGKRLWLKLNQAFMRDYSASDPLFRRIPQQFLHFLEQASPELQALLPPYTQNLCHYEWVELLVASTQPAAGPEIIDADGDLACSRPAFAPGMQLLAYDYPVHRISPRYKPTQQQSTQLLVFLNANDAVKFTELNAVTYRLIELLRNTPATGREAILQVAMELQHPEPERMIEFGLAILQDLRHQGVIIGTQA